MDVSEILEAVGIVTGVDLAITALAGVAAAVVLGFVGFKLVGIAMRWAASLGGDAPRSTLEMSDTEFDEFEASGMSFEEWMRR